ncbi:MAG: FKBP-type peptidyl-prolyl cis-trans isomerase [Verrucomicrobiota bacterium]|nr:FKBP-type peptidyl-prolyl cis-trans isomerase [Verrucomicrobiota bacterium]
MNGKKLVGTYKFDEPSELDLETIIPGLAHGLLGMSEGEIREIYIHPDFAYGMDSNFFSEVPIKVRIELIELKSRSEKEKFPPLQPVDAIHYAPNITSCEDFITLQNKYSYYCGLRVRTHYQKAASLFQLNDVVVHLQEPQKISLSPQEKKLLLKLEWLLYQ